MLETIGLLLISFLFFFGAYNHLSSSTEIAGYALESTRCPFIAAIAGWPTGLYLAATGVLIGLGSDVGLWMALGFMVATQALFHRSLKDPNHFKHLCIVGSLLVLIAT